MSEFGGGVEEIQEWPLVIKGKSLRISSIAKEIRLGKLVSDFIIRNYNCMSSMIIGCMFSVLNSAFSDFCKFFRNRLADYT